MVMQRSTNSLRGGCAVVKVDYGDMFSSDVKLRTPNVCLMYANEVSVSVAMAVAELETLGRLEAGNSPT